MSLVILANAGEARDTTLMVDLFGWSSPTIELKTLVISAGCLLILLAGMISFSSVRKKFNKS
jgi:putative Ca2+/H+ antiporter (TMEM165/GDT1 family)